MKTPAQEGWVLKPDVDKSHNELLNTDLSHVGAKIIPADFASAPSLSGPKILQFKRVKDVSHSKISHENGSSKSMFRITLSDGNSTCSAMNLQQIPGLSGKVYPGTKLKIKSGGAQVLGGFLLLTPTNCEILGGRVEKLVENIEKNENISKKKGNDGGPPKFVPFGSSANYAAANNHISLEKPIREPSRNDNETEISVSADMGTNSRNDGKKFDRDRKSGHQKDRGNKFSGKRGQSARNSDDQRGQSFNSDRGRGDDRGRSDDRERGKGRGKSKQNFRGSSWSRGDSHHENRSNRYNDRDREDDGSRDSGRSRGRGRGSRGKDRSRRDDDYSPPERSHPTGFNLGALLQDFPALGSQAEPASDTREEDDVYNSGERYNARSRDGSREYESRGRSSDSRGRRNDRSRGRGRGSRGRGNSRSRREDYPQTKPAGYKADLEADFPALGGGVATESSSAPSSSSAKPSASKSRPHALVDDEGFEIHDHLLYDDNGPPRQLHDPSFHKQQGYDNYRSGPDTINDRMQDMNLSGSNARDKGRSNRGGGGNARNQEDRRRDYGNGGDQSHRRGGDYPRYQGRIDYDGYDQRYNDQYEQRYNDRYDQRYNDRYDQRYDDRYDQRYNDQYDQRNNHYRNDHSTSSNRSNLSGKRGRSSGNRRY